MKFSEKAVHDGVSLIASYHFLLALASIIGLTAVIVYAMLPPIGESAPDLPQKLFPPFTGFFLGFLLAALYALIGLGLLKINNKARMGAVFLALFGIVGGIFALIGSLAGGVNLIAPDWLKLGMLGMLVSCVYLLITIFDVIVLVFLLNEQVRTTFYNNTWGAEPEEESIAIKAAPVNRTPGPKKDPVKAPIT